MLNIVIPMAGQGSRFARAGYQTPKPLIDVKGRPMIEWVVENLTPTCPHRFIFICQKNHVTTYHLDALLPKLAPHCIIEAIDGITDGAACTVLCAKAHIDNDQPLMIANSDQWIDANIDDYLDTWQSRKHTGHIMTMTSHDPKWSYIAFDEQGHICDVVEKVVVSDQATVGIYNIAHGHLFCQAAQQMIAANDRSKGEFYVAPTYRYLIEQGHTISLHNIGLDQEGMFGLGIPEDLDYFVATH